MFHFLLLFSKIKLQAGRTERERRNSGRGRSKSQKTCPDSLLEKSIKKQAPRSSSSNMLVLFLPCSFISFALKNNVTVGSFCLPHIQYAKMLISLKWLFWKGLLCKGAPLPFLYLFWIEKKSWRYMDIYIICMNFKITWSYLCLIRNSDDCCWKGRDRGIKVWCSAAACVIFCNSCIYSAKVTLEVENPMQVSEPFCLTCGKPVTAHSTNTIQRSKYFPTKWIVLTDISSPHPGRFVW